MPDREELLRCPDELLSKLDCAINLADACGYRVILEVMREIRDHLTRSLDVERVARAIYAARPFVLASTATTFGHQLAKTLDWDGAPAYYQEDMRQLARAAIASDNGGGL